MSHQDPNSTPSSGGKIALGIVAGCLVAVVLIAGGVGVCGFFMYRSVAVQMRDVGAELARVAMDQMIDESYVPPLDKEIMHEQVDRVVNKYKNHQIELGAAVRILTELMTSPVYSLLVLNTVENKHLNRSELDDAEKEEGRLTLARVSRGLVEETIKNSDLTAAIESISETVVSENEFGEEQTQQRLKQELRPQELRNFLAQCKDLADAASIPEEPYQVRYGEEFKKAIDQALDEY